MLMGIFFATFLVGSLWYLFGIGQAILFRERAQEVADSAALSSAIIHAQGMNFIAALNLIQFALVIGHMIMAIIWLILLIISVVTAPETVGISTAIIEGIKESTFTPVWHSFDEAFVFPEMKVAAITQSVVSIGTPWIGAVVGGEVGEKYGESSYAPSMSMIPTAALEGPLNFGIAKLFGAVTAPPLAGKLGLPVRENAFSFMCEHAFKASYDWARHAITDNPVYSFIINLIKNPIVGGITDVISVLPGGSSAPAIRDAILWVNDLLQNDGDGFTNQINSAIGTAGGTLTSFALCNAGNLSWLASLPGVKNIPFIKGGLESIDKLTGPAKVAALDANPWIPPAFSPQWGTIFGLGPKSISTNAGNGRDWMYVWGFAGKLGETSTYDDKFSTKLIRSAGWNNSGTESVERKSYGAQAEFFYDCDTEWAECNAADASVFGMRWRARLRQVKEVNVGADIVDSAAIGLTGSLLSGVLGKVGGKINPSHFAGASLGGIFKSEGGYAGSLVTGGQWGGGNGGALESGH